MATTSLKNALLLTGPLVFSVLAATGAPAAQADDGTRRQHRDWMRKFETSGGSLNGAVTRQGQAPAEPRHRPSAASGEPSGEG